MIMPDRRRGGVARVRVVSLLRAPGSRRTNFG